MKGGTRVALSRREFNNHKKWQRREWKLQIKSDRRAMKLQAKEYERRLIVLNGEHKTNIENWLTSVRKESFDEFKKLMDERVDDLQRAEDQRRGGMIVLRLLAGAGALGFVLSILNTTGVTGLR